MLQINKQAMAKAVQQIGWARAYVGGRYLMKALSQPGKGIHWPENPNPSSLPGDYPAIQTGALMESVNVLPVANGAGKESTETTFKIGFFQDMNAEGFAHAVELESRPPDQGGRYPLEKLLTDRKFKRAVMRGKL